MDSKELKIGYVPYLPDLSQPADRRRFPFFAKQHHINFEIAQFNKKYDVILLTAPSNLSKWLIYKRKHPNTKFIFEMVDSLIFRSDVFSTLFKGLGRFLQRKESLLFINYKKLIVQWLKIADVIICSSTELKKSIEKWNNNVVVSLDYLQNEYEFSKNDYSINEKMKFLWEGQSVTLSQFLILKDVLKHVSSFCELHIITAEKYPLFGNLIHKDVEQIMKELPIKTIFHKWNLKKNREIFSQCDCGIIPLSKENKMAWHKPANKLISFWFAGLPTLVSATPAYIEVMKNAGTDLYCTDTEDWVDRIRMVYSMKEEERKMMAIKNLDYVRTHFSNDALDIVWFEVFEKVNQQIL